VQSWTRVVGQTIGFCRLSVRQKRQTTENRWSVLPLVFAAASLMAHAAGPVDFGMAEFDAAVVDYNSAHKVKISKPKIIAELNLEPPETFRVEPYTAGGAHITGGDLRGLMYGLLEAADQIRATGRLKRAHGVPDIPLRGVRIRAEPQSAWFASGEFWRGYFAQLARDRFNRVQIVFGDAPDRSGLATLGMISQTALQYGIDAGVGLQTSTPAALERLLVECLAVRFVAIHSTADEGPLFQVLREIGRRVVLELPAREDTASQSGMPLRFFAPYGAAPNPRPPDFYLQLYADQLGYDPDSVGALLTSLNCGIEIASPLDDTGRPDPRQIGVWGRLVYGQNK
jgi:hypothetical protein